jgi:hypothetical protein
MVPNSEKYLSKSPIVPSFKRYKMSDRPNTCIAIHFYSVVFLIAIAYFHLFIFNIFDT